MIRFTKKLDYCLSSLTYLAKIDRASSARELADRFGFPLSIVANLLKELTTGNLLISTRGPDGGYKLAKSPDLISIKEVMEIVEGPIYLTDCMEGNDKCSAVNICNSKRSLIFIQSQILKLLQTMTLLDMIKTDESWNYYFNPVFQNLTNNSRKNEAK